MNENKIYPMMEPLEGSMKCQTEPLRVLNKTFSSKTERTPQTQCEKISE